VRLIDIKCAKCERVVIDHLERDEDRSRPVCCEQPMERVFLPTNRGQVIGDECDVWVKNGLCHSDGSPQHFTSKQAMKRAADAKGYINYVTHQPSKGSDKSKHTSKWQ
jgi:hypothetical protein